MLLVTRSIANAIIMMMPLVRPWWSGLSPIKAKRLNMVAMIASPTAVRQIAPPPAGERGTADHDGS